MKIIKSKLPECPDFHPEAEGYVPMREPSERKFLIIASVLTAALFAACAAVCAGLAALRGSFPLTFELIDICAAALTFVAVNVLMIPPHEILHALFFPGGLRSDRVIIGAHLKKGMFYAFYDGEMPKRRLALVFIVPFLTLSVIPLILLAAGVQSLILSELFIIHTAACSGDLIGLTLMLTRVPKGAVVRNKGYKTYYKAIPKEA